MVQGLPYQTKHKRKWLLEEVDAAGIITAGDVRANDALIQEPLHLPSCLDTHHRDASHAACT